jgi:putative ATP-dependent endonuclease of OLD family
VHYGASTSDDVVIEVAFTSLPEKIELEEGIETSLQEEMLVDAEGNLRIRKTYPRNNLAKFNVTLIARDFEDEQFAGLAALKERDLNDRLKSLGIDVTRSGRGITNKSKREALRDKAKDGGIQLEKVELSLTTNDALWKKIDSLLPDFELFETDTSLGIGAASFQSPFRPIIKTAAEQSDVIDAKDTFTGAISVVLQDEVNKIFERLRRHTDAFVGLTARPEFSWDKAVNLDIQGKDHHGVENSLNRRGSGMRRLLMVAFFQYLAEKGYESGGDFVFAVEEPENCLHPGLQRELATSFRQLADEGYQVIVTSHSPVFAGASPIDDLALVVRTAGVAKAIQTPKLDLSDVAQELGVEPADQITGYKACIFAEGPDDIEFWKKTASKLKEAGQIDDDFDDKEIGFIPYGGDNLKHWVNLRAMQRLNCHFGVVSDSDRESPEHNVPDRKMNWKKACEKQGGRFFILRKREIENYLHQDAIARSGRSLEDYDDFTDMKAIFGENVYKVIRDMSCGEILEMDQYVEDGVEHHELKEIIQTFLALPDVKDKTCREFSSQNSLTNYGL